MADTLVFEHFEVVRREDGAPYELGRGAMGVTYKAWDTRLRCMVALKVITPALLDTASVRERFLREARAAAHLHHPNVANVFYLGTVKKTVFYAMEFVEGETVAAFLKRHGGPLPVAPALDIAEQAAQGLAAAHERGLIHRDIKPANLMVMRASHATHGTPALRVKIIDFGLAKSFLSDPGSSAGADASLTGHDGPIGTPHFMSPEQIERGAGNHVIDVRTDIYSLGATLWYLVAGQPPFSGTSLQVLNQHLDKAPPVELLAQTRVPAGVVGLLERMLAKDPRDRPVSCQELIPELRALRREAEESSADRTAAETICLLLPSPPATSQDAARSMPRPAGFDHASQGRTRGLVMIGAAILLLALIAVTIRLRWHPFAARLIPPAQTAGPAVAQKSISPVAETPVPSTKSIAVLPFDSLTGGEDNVFLADGVQEDILTNLAKAADLKVISRTSVMAYRTSANRPVLREIARALGVAYVVEGTVRREGNRVRVVARLIDARNEDALVWSDEYNRELASVFDLQSQIAGSIASQLQARLSPQEKTAMAEPATRDLAANALYQSTTALMQAGFGDDEPDPEAGWKKAIRQLEEAIALDPNFVQAHSRLAEAHALLYFYGYDSTDSRREAIRSAAESALRLRPDAGESHRAMGIYDYYGLKNFDLARAELLLAQRSLPNDAKTLLYLGLIERRQGRWDSALEYFRKCVELDPREPDTLNKYADTLRGLHRYPEAAATLDRALALAPRQSWFHKLKAYLAVDANADVPAARAELAAIPADYDSEGSVTTLRIYLSLCERDPAGAARALAGSPLLKFAPGISGQIWPRSWYEGRIARASGDRSAARNAFTAARLIVEPQTRDRPDDPRPLMILGLIDAALGRRDDALREGRAARALQSDAYSGPTIALQLALLYAWTGENDLAMETLQAIAAHPNGPTYGDLRLNPDWDPLRGDSRFKALAASLAPGRTSGR